MSNSHENQDAQDGQSDITLSITFRGPFLYMFPPVSSGDDNPIVDIYAPYCPYHEGSFFYSDSSYSETDLWSKVPHNANQPTVRSYSIAGTGITPNSDDPTIIYPGYLPAKVAKAGGPILRPEATDNPKPVCERALFHISVPRPDFIYPLYCDTVAISKAGSSGSNDRYATSLRFYYQWIVGSDINLVPPGLDPLTLTPPVPSQLPQYGDIEVRYEGLGIADPNDSHSDARSCFINLAQLAGLPWLLDYGSGASPDPLSSVARKTQDHLSSAAYKDQKNLCIHTGGDCYAPSIVLGLT